MYSPVSNRRGGGWDNRRGGVEKISRINSPGVGIVGGLEKYLESNSGLCIIMHNIIHNYKDNNTGHSLEWLGVVGSGWE